MLDLETQVKYVKGVGPRVAEWLEQKNIFTVEDLLYYLPFRYEDRLNPRGIGELQPGEMATVIAEVRNAGMFRTKRMPIFEMVAGQGASTLKCLWFNGAYLRDRFRPGNSSRYTGRLNRDGKAAACRSSSRNLRSWTMDKANWKATARTQPTQRK